MITEPLLPMETPTSWMILQGDQHRRPLEFTAGITGEQSSLDWIGPIRELIHRVVRSFPRLLVAPVALLLKAVVWVLRFASVHKGRGLLHWHFIKLPSFLGFFIGGMN
jgi:hypothetical protein